MNRLFTVIEVPTLNPVIVPCFLCIFFLRFYTFINLFIYLKIRFKIISKPFGLLNIAYMTANYAFPIEFMHSVAFRICVFGFVNIPFDGHLVYMLKLFSNNA